VCLRPTDVMMESPVPPARRCSKVNGRVDGAARTLLMRLFERWWAEQTKCGINWALLIISPIRCLQLGWWV